MSNIFFSEPEMMEHDKLPKQNNRPTHVFEATPDDYDLDETFGVVATKPKKNLRPTSELLVGLFLTCTN